MAEFKSYKSKLVDFGIKSDSFKDDSGDQVDYKQVVVRLSIDGDVEDIVLSGKSAPTPKIFQAILGGAGDQSDNSLLGE